MVPKGAVPVRSRNDPRLIQFTTGDVVEIAWTISLGSRKYDIHEISKGTPAIIVGVGKLVALVGPACGDIVISGGKLVVALVGPACGDVVVSGGKLVALVGPACGDVVVSGGKLVVLVGPACGDVVVAVGGITTKGTVTV
jgi:predicted RNA-binding Zn-ribbon protein involved in translation (DUF1610 family)